MARTKSCFTLFEMSIKNETLIWMSVINTLVLFNKWFSSSSYAHEFLLAYQNFVWK